MLLDVVRVKPLPNHMLSVEFENGEERLFDFKNELLRPIFAPLKNEKLFNMARAESGGVVWNDQLDIAPDYLYEKSIAADKQEQR